LILFYFFLYLNSQLFLLILSSPSNITTELNSLQFLSLINVRLGLVLIPRLVLVWKFLVFFFCLGQGQSSAPGKSCSRSPAAAAAAAAPEAEAQSRPPTAEPPPHNRGEPRGRRQPEALQPRLRLPRNRGEPRLRLDPQAEEQRPGFQPRPPETRSRGRVSDPDPPRPRPGPVPEASWPRGPGCGYQQPPQTQPW
jgi:hypothetical protein